MPPTARPPERVTASDVARRAGVSQSAVSRVFTPGASASQRTVEKVRCACGSTGVGKTATTVKRPTPIQAAVLAAAISVSALMRRWTSSTLL